MLYPGEVCNIIIKSKRECEKVARALGISTHVEQTSSDNVQSGCVYDEEGHLAEYGRLNDRSHRSGRLYFNTKSKGTADEKRHYAKYCRPICSDATGIFNNCLHIISPWIFSCTKFPRG